MSYLGYKLTGDILVDRAHWKNSGCPSDHPYITDPDGVYRQPSGPVEPLAFQMSDGQRMFMDSYTPIARSQSKSNIAVLLRELERI